MLLLSSPALALFCGFVGTMQVFDYIFWKNQEPNRVNYVTTKVAMIFNHLQPFVLAFAIRALSPDKGAFSFPSVAVLWAYAAVVVPYTVLTWRRIDHTLVRPSSYPGLKWQWNVRPGAVVVYTIFLAALLIVALFELPRRLNLLTFTIVGITFLVSFVLHFRGWGTVGRFWCNYGAYSTFVLAIGAELSRKA